MKKKKKPNWEKRLLQYHQYEVLSSKAVDEMIVMIKDILRKEKAKIIKTKNYKISYTEYIAPEYSPSLAYREDGEYKERVLFIRAKDYVDAQDKFLTEHKSNCEVNDIILVE